MSFGITLRREDLLYVLGKCAERHGDCTSLRDVMQEISKLEPESIAIEANNLNDTTPMWKHPSL